MKEWRAQLVSALAHGLHNLDKEQDDKVVEWLALGGDDLEPEEEQRRKHARSTLERRFVHQDREGGAARHDSTTITLERIHYLMIPCSYVSIECNVISSFVLWMLLLHSTLGLDKLQMSLDALACQICKSAQGPPHARLWYLGRCHR